MISMHTDMAPSTSIHDLPPVLFRDILRQVRGRPVPGTNRYALVCNTWRTASPHDEQLQLYLDQAAINGDQLQRATEWLAQHGKRVPALELPSTTWGFVKTTLSYPGISSSLQRLDVRGPNTLVGLLAAHVQLPHLQHLTACISMEHAWEVEPGVVLLEEGQQTAGALHPLQQACPGLKELCLRLDDNWAIIGGMDALLPRLLPPTLQQLRLGMGLDPIVITPHVALGGLTSLRYLELQYFNIDMWSPSQLPANCSLHLVDCLGVPIRPDCYGPLHGKLVGLCWRGTDVGGDTAVVSRLTRLTSLSLGVSDWNVESVQPLAALKALKQLDLYVGGGYTMAADMLRHVASTCSLRRLILDTYGHGSDQLVSAVGALTQLTSLSWCTYGTWGGQAAAGGQQPVAQGLGEGVVVGAAAAEQAAAFVADAAGVGGGQLQQNAPLPQQPGLQWALRGLVGLRQLQLSVWYLLSYPTTWLSHLTQLSLLAVSCINRSYAEGADGVQQPALSSCVAAVVPRLQGSVPASLQQVVLYVPGTPVCDVVPSPLPGVAVGVRPDPAADWMGVAEGPRPMQPCSHLPGVWELLPEQA